MNVGIDPTSNNNHAIKRAGEFGYFDIMKLLLSDPRVRPGNMNNYAIRKAAENGHTEIVKLLLADPRVNPAI